jgi:hypothetical protein
LLAGIVASSLLKKKKMSSGAEASTVGSPGKTILVNNQKQGYLEMVLFLLIWIQIYQAFLPWPSNGT